MINPIYFLGIPGTELNVFLMIILTFMILISTYDWIECEPPEKPIKRVNLLNSTEVN